MGELGLGPVLLVEFERPKRPIPSRAAVFPFLLGLATEKEISAQWIVLSAGFEHDDARRFASIPEETLCAFRKVIADIRPTNIVFSEPASEFLWSNITSVLEYAPASYVSMPPYAPVAEGLEALGLTVDEASWESPLLETVAPMWRYDFVGPPPPTRVIEIVTGGICGYRAKLDQNPFFKDVDLTRSESRVGCAFCLTHRSHKGPKINSNQIELALRQLDVAVRAHPQWPGRVVLVGDKLFRIYLEELFHEILAMEIPPTVFSFFCRLDEVMKQASTIEKLLPVLQRHGHALDLFSMGVENFSPIENLRFNKGFSTRTILNAIKHLQDWSSRFPGTLRYQQGGLSFIMFTPWTSLEDVRINLDYGRRLGLRSEFFGSRLVLTEGRAITLLAEKDGVLADDFEDPGFWQYDSGCLRPGEKEIPWRFQHKEITALYGVYMRMCSFCYRDEAYRRVRAWMELHREKSPLDLAELALDAAANPSPVRTLEELLERLECAPITENEIAFKASRTDQLDFVEKIARDIATDYEFKGILQDSGRVELVYSRQCSQISIWIEAFDLKRPHFRAVGPIAIGHKGEPTQDILQLIERLCEKLLHEKASNPASLDDLAHGILRSRKIDIDNPISANSRREERQ